MEKAIPGTLESIVADDIDKSQVSEDQKRRTFFKQWKQMNGFDATYKNLISALLKIKCRQDAEHVCKLLQESNTPQFQEAASDAVTTMPVADKIIRMH